MDINKFESKIEDFRVNVLGNEFEWRQDQKEAIFKIIEAYYNKKKVVIVDAPTGSGKSIIAMAVSYLLNKDNKEGYILASDLALQEQYEIDIEKFNIQWGSVKGVDNYICIDNDEKHSLGTCKIRSILPKRMHCYSDCPYFMARDFASRSSTAVLNYSYWLTMMNYVNKYVDDPPFSPRDFCICDEAHKILDIVQNQYSPKFDKDSLEKLERLTDFLRTYKLKDHSIELNIFGDCLQLIDSTENQQKLHEILLTIETSLKSYVVSYETFKKKIKKEYPNQSPPKSWRYALNLFNYITDLYCKIQDYNEIIKNTSTRNLIKNPGRDNVVFNCLEESYMMKKYFHEWTGFTVLMSATFADVVKYMQNNAIANVSYVKLRSTFDFSKSPIYFYNKRRMSYNHIEKNLPWLYSTISNILEKHPNENGIIHTASYDLSLKIFNGLQQKDRDRLLIYSGTEEKKEVLNVLKNNKNKILIGPSLLEGLDLKDSWSRFQIFAKVPYLSLADKFVAAKLKVSPDWYREKAVLNILQGTGRSIRSDVDWAVTYFLDASLADLIHNSRKSFPDEFLQRIVVAS